MQMATKSGGMENSSCCQVESEIKENVMQLESWKVS